MAKKDGSGESGSNVQSRALSTQPARLMANWFIISMICGSENRLGRNGAMEIKSHPFFAGVDFNTLRRIRTPFGMFCFSMLS